MLTFDDKYCAGQREFPANISKTLSNKIKRIAKKIYTQLDFTGVMRIDFFCVNEKVYVNEINSVPGSLAYYLFSQTITDFKVVLDQVIGCAERDFARESSFRKKFQSSVLNITGVKSSKRL